MWRAFKVSSVFLEVQAQVSGFRVEGVSDHLPAGRSPSPAKMNGNIGPLIVRVGLGGVYYTIVIIRSPPE